MKREEPKVFIKSITVTGSTVDEASRPVFDVTVTVGIEPDHVELHVKISKTRSFDGAVLEAMRRVGEWGSGLGEAGRQAFEAPK